MSARRKFYLISSLLFCATLHAATPAFDVKAGVTHRIACVDAPELSFDLFIPAAYIKESERAFPVLYLSNPGAHPNIAAHTEWAERRGVVLITINDSRNGPWSPIFKAQEAVWKTAESALRLHPCLRFSMGMSGAAPASFVLASRHAEHFAGVVLEGHGTTGDPAPKHLALAFIHGDKEPNIPVIDICVTRFRRAGNPVRRFIKPGGHVPGSTEEEERFLDWMLDYQSLAHPKLSAADKTRAKAAMLERFAAAAKLDDAKVRFEALGATLELPTVAKWPESKTFINASAKAALDAAQLTSDKPAKYAILGTISFRDWFAQADPQTRTALEKALAEITNDPQIKPLFDADTAYAKAVVSEKKAGENAAGLIAVRAMFESISKRFPDTAAGKNALDDVRRLTPPSPSEPRIGIAK